MEVTQRTLKRNDGRPVISCPLLGRSKNGEELWPVNPKPQPFFDGLSSVENIIHSQVPIGQPEEQHRHRLRGSSVPGKSETLLSCDEREARSYSV
jgi:hypothetical protein